MAKGSKVAIAGATGFVGRALIQALLGRGHEVVGITRGRLPDRCAIHPGARCPIDWRRADLYSMRQCEHALAGVETAFYLVHSMLPSARLTQGHFQDMDLIMADNFAQAAKKMGVKHIIYLGGFIPPGQKLSPHLASRLEVERTLASHGVPVTALRAGIIVGPGGSSTNMILLSVARMPLIPCPAHTLSLTQPIALNDVLSLLLYAVDHPSPETRTFDIGGPEVLSYRQVLERTARVLKLKRILVPLPFNVPFFSGRLLSWVTRAPLELSEPLVESLKHNMVARDLSLQKEAQLTPTPFEKALERAITEPSEGSRHTCCLPTPSWRRLFAKKDVRSVQRLDFPIGKTVEWVARQYALSHPGAFSLLMRGEVDDSGNVRMYLRSAPLLLLELTFASDHSSQDRFLFFITGGALAYKEKTHDPEHRPRIEFRRALAGEKLIVAIHDYHPTLPWPIYSTTQALLHLLFMKRFAHRLDELARAG